MDSLTTEKEIKYILIQIYGEQVGEIKVFIFHANKREPRLAVVAFEEGISVTMLHAGRIKISLGYSHVRKNVKL